MVTKTNWIKEGTRFGDCIFIRYTGNKRSGSSEIELKCVCGKIYTDTELTIKRKKVTSCGCLRDISLRPNDQLGAITVVRKTLNKTASGSSLYEVVCKCGEKYIRERSYLFKHNNPECVCVKKNDTIYPGKIFGRLTTIEPTGRDANGNVIWKCLCSCGNNTNVTATRLNKGITQSCGCYRKEVSGNKARTHGMKGTRLYRIWRNMKRRCDDPNNISYPYYGGRGIAYCNEWEAFENFYSDMGPTYKEGLTIERKDSNGNYTPDNCRWATYREQANNRSNNVHVNDPYTDEIMTASELARKYGLHRDVIYDRLKRGVKGKDLVKPVK